MSAGGHESAEPSARAGGDAIGASDDACAPPAEKEKGEEAGKLKSFARRFCPQRSPAKEKWFVLRKVFLNEIQESAEGLGSSCSKLQAWFFQKDLYHKS